MAKGAETARDQAEGYQRQVRAAVGLAGGSRGRRGRGELRQAGLPPVPSFGRLRPGVGGRQPDGPAPAVADGGAHHVVVAADRCGCSTSDAAAPSPRSSSPGSSASRCGPPTSGSTHSTTRQAGRGRRRRPGVAGPGRGPRAAVPRRLLRPGGQRRRLPLLRHRGLLPGDAAPGGQGRRARRHRVPGPGLRVRAGAPPTTWSLSGSGSTRPSTRRPGGGPTGSGAGWSPSRRPTWSRTDGWTGCAGRRWSGRSSRRGG